MKYLIVFMFVSKLLANQPLLRQIEAKTVIKDFQGALFDVEMALKENPDELQLLKWKVTLLAKICSEKSLLECFKTYQKVAKEPYADRDLLEIVSWGVIEEAFHSSSPELRFYALLGAYQSQQAQGVQLLLKALNDPHALIRAISCQMSGGLRDQSLKEKIYSVFLNDPDFRVHLEALRSLGQMKCLFAKEALVSLVSNSKLSQEERGVALEALVTLTEGVNEKELKSLVLSHRLGFRLLSCRLVEWFDEETDPQLLKPLLNDPIGDVRCAAVHALGERQTCFDELYPLLKDEDIRVAIHAAFALKKNEGIEFLKQTLLHPKKEIRCLSAKALSSMGVHGQEALLETFKKTTEFLPKLNLALGVVKTQKELKEVSQFLVEAITQEHTLLIKKEESLFEVIMENTSKESGFLFEKKESVDQRVRFQLLNQLALLDPVRALEASRVFLKKKRGGFTSDISSILLKEGDEEALEIIKELLNDKDPEIRLESALVLAFWGREGKTLEILENGYHEATGDVKRRILEAISQLGMIEAVPFLVKVLFEPHQTLRVLAAGALLRTLSN
jgi:HEAT repeat protein